MNATATAARLVRSYRKSFAEDALITSIMTATVAVFVGVIVLIVLLATGVVKDDSDSDSGVLICNNVGGVSICQTY